MVISFGGQLREGIGILHATEGGFLGCQEGREMDVRVAVEGQYLKYFDGTRGRLRKLQRLLSQPQSLLLTLELPEPAALPEARVREIQREIWDRDQAEQARRGGLRAGVSPWLQVSSEPAGNSVKGKIDFQVVEQFNSNAEYIRKLILEVGWIDVGRFGYFTSKSAFFLVQHSWDPSLLLAILPYVKKDVDAGLMDGSSYALLFDRSQLALGGAQRFGSQVVRDENGQVMVLPVEDPEGVDARRRSLGMMPLKEYVGALGSAEVRFSTSCRRPLTSPHTATLHPTASETEK
jgi:hypothetical protein